MTRTVSNNTDIANVIRISENVDQIPLWRLKWIDRLCNPVYNGFLCSVNLFAVLISFYADHSFEDTRIEQLSFWRVSSICFNTAFLVDLVMNLGICQLKYIIKNRKHLLVEIVLQLCSIAVYANLFSKDSLDDFSMGVGFCMTIYMIRLIRLTEYFVEL